MSKMIKLIREFETISPASLLQKFFKNGEIPAKNLEIINNLTSKKRLGKERINVILHAALLQDNMKLNAETVETFAKLLEGTQTHNIAEDMLIIKEYLFTEERA